VVRDRATGLLERIIQQNFSVDEDGELHPQQVAAAILETSLAPVRDEFGNELSTTPSMMPNTGR
jgi:hypothetical protein